MDDALFRLLAVISRERKTTISDLVRRAVKRVYGRAPSKEARLKALHAVCGLWKDRKDLPPTEEYVRSLRRDTRARRLGLE